MDNFMKLKLIISLLVLFNSISVFGQSTIKGKIIDETSQLNIKGVVVSVDVLNYKYTTDSSGYFIIKNVPAGTYNIKTSHNEYFSSERIVKIKKSKKY